MTKAIDTARVKSQYEMLDDATKACVATILYTMCSVLQAVYQLQKLPKEQSKFTQK